MSDQEQQNQLVLLPEMLLDWYDSNARILPWREQPTPYRVWISEVMLQQTRVEAVKPYFDRFLQALPDVAALAAAPEEQLLKLWEGLGYYNRVRNLQKAAGCIMSDYDGKLPACYQQLLTLPGIGHYTAGAIASIAFGIAMPAVDGNVLRVVSRLLASREDIMKEKVKTNMADMLTTILPHQRAGDFNQALMELGATICLPSGTAKCGVCPAAAICQAYHQDIVMQLPVKTAKKQRRIEKKTIFVLLADGKAAFRKRPDQGLLAALWELPNAPGKLTVVQARQQLLDWGVAQAAIYKLPPAKHMFTHIEWHMTGYAVYAPNGVNTSDLVWVSPAELNHQIAVPTAFKLYADRIAYLLEDGI